jgi:hypothetical protein
VTQRHDGIEFGGLGGGVVPEEDADGCRRAKSKWNGERDEGGAHFAERAKQQRAAHTEEDARQPTNEAEDDGFEQELGLHVVGARAERHAQADLTGALGDANQHDVHDADAADDERNARHPCQQVAECGGGGFLCGDDVLLGLDGEIGLGGVHIVPRRKQTGDLGGDTVNFSWLSTLT